jgi:hemerythrin superfamily protein
LVPNLSNIIYQELQKQAELDKAIVDLTETMNDVFDIITAADEDRRNERTSIIMRTIQQTTECGWFIRDYIKTDSFCE